MSKSESNFTQWPKNPYKGLNYYDRDDAPIFAGRDDDINRCAKEFSTQNTKLLLLHGQTGCGKSSFLRAGLIPFIEKPEHGYTTVKQDSNSESKSLFIRSTNRPINNIAESIYTFSTQKHTKINFSGNEVEIDCRKALLGHKSLKSFIDCVNGDPNLLKNSLEMLTKDLSYTLVFIIDQAEEVLTIDPSKTGDHDRTIFFDFVALCSNLDLKFIITLRTEYFGRFIDEIRSRLIDTSHMSDYLLRELNEEQIVEAIKRPTEAININGFGIPMDFYHFYYSDGLPEKIASDLRETTQAGGILPVMQIVCGRLYDSIQRSNQTEILEITNLHYQALGKASGQIIAHLRDKIQIILKKKNADQEIHHRKINNWLRVLKSLAKVQVDGSVTTDIIKKENLFDIAKQYNCDRNFDETIKYLSKEKNRILRKFHILKVDDNTPIECYSLGHDALGLVLTNWIDESVYDERILEKQRRINKILAAVLTILFFISLLYGDFLNSLKISDISQVSWFILYFASIAIMSALMSPRMHRLFISSMDRFVPRWFLKLSLAIYTPIFAILPKNLVKRFFSRRDMYERVAGLNKTLDKIMND